MKRSSSDYVVIVGGYYVGSFNDDVEGSNMTGDARISLTNHLGDARRMRLSSAKRLVHDHLHWRITLFSFASLTVRLWNSENGADFDMFKLGDLPMTRFDISYMPFSNAAHQLRVHLVQKVMLKPYESNAQYMDRIERLFEMHTAPKPLCGKCGILVANNNKHDCPCRNTLATRGHPYCLCCSECTNKCREKIEQG